MEDANQLSRLQVAAVAIGGALAIMWSLEVLDLVIDGSLDRHGINPRRLSGADGILWAPFLHGGFGHLISNTIPFAVLAAIVMSEGLRRWMTVTAIVALGGGTLTWLLARSKIHIGASGVIFGYLGYLLANAYFAKKVRSILVAVVVGIAYGGSLLFGLIPRPGVSWEGHVFGLAAGVAAAYLLNRSPQPSPASG